MYALMYDSPFGRMQLVEDHESLVRLDLPGDLGCLPPGCTMESTPFLAHARQELDAYFRGDLRVFDIPLNPSGTPFQREVWQALLRIPYGETRSYLDVAKMVGRPRAARAVGGANHGNPIAIIIPCHRVIRADGGLGGYGGGVDVKERLLALENRMP